MSTFEHLEVCNLIFVHCLTIFDVFQAYLCVSLHVKVSRNLLTDYGSYNELIQDSFAFTASDILQHVAVLNTLRLVSSDVHVTI